MPVVDRFIYLRHSKVWTDQEDVTTKIDLPFSQHQAPHLWGFFVYSHTHIVGQFFVDLGKINRDFYKNYVQT